MKYTPDYQITLLNGEKIPLLFNTIAFRSYSQRKGIEFEELLESVGNGKVFKSNNIPEMVLAGAEAFARSNRLPFEADLTDSELWIDEIGGLNSPVILEIYKHFTGKLLNLPAEKFEAIWNGAVDKASEPVKEEKKSKQVKSSTHGTSSTSMLRQAG